MKKTYEKECRKIVKAWEALPGGRVGIYAVEDWLREDMSPAINSVRRALGLKVPTSNQQNEC